MRGLIGPPPLRVVVMAGVGNRLYWQAGPHIRSGVLQGSGVTRQLEVDIMYDGPVINAVDRMFAAQGMYAVHLMSFLMVRCRALPRKPPLLASWATHSLGRSRREWC